MAIALIPIKLQFISGVICDSWNEFDTFDPKSDTLTP